MEERQRHIIEVSFTRATFLHGQVSGIIMGVLGTAKSGVNKVVISSKSDRRIFDFDCTEDELNRILNILDELWCEHKRIAEYKLIK